MWTQRFVTTKVNSASGIINTLTVSDRSWTRLGFRKRSVFFPLSVVCSFLYPWNFPSVASVVRYSCHGVEWPAAFPESPCPCTGRELESRRTMIMTPPPNLDNLCNQGTHFLVTPGKRQINKSSTTPNPHHHPPLRSYHPSSTSVFFQAYLFHHQTQHQPSSSTLPNLSQLLLPTLEPDVDQEDVYGVMLHMHFLLHGEI